MKKQLLALVAVLGLAGFASVGAGATGNIHAQSNVIHWATVVFCDNDGDAQTPDEVCVGGHTGFEVWEFVDVTLSAVPGSTATRFLVR